MEELKDIIGYIRSVEAFRPTRLVWVKLEDPDMSLEEAKRLLKELWPEPEGPPFMATLKREFASPDSFYRGRMTDNFSKLFTVTDPITHEPLTIFVEAFTPMGGETLFGIKALEGEYDTQEEFEDAREYVMQGLELRWKYDKHAKGDDKLCSSITLVKLGTRQLIDSLNEALQFYIES